MKKYSDLSSLQKDFAIDAALAILAKTLVDKDFDYQFRSPICQKHFNEALVFSRKKSEAIKRILESDEIAEELYPIAESMAETAYYPNGEETVIEGVAV